MKTKPAYISKLWRALRWPLKVLARYWRHSRWHKFLVILVSVGLLVLGGMYGIARWYIWSERHQPLTMGVTFVPDYAQYLGLNPQQTMQALINDVGVRQFRLTSYWSDIETSRGHYDFSTLDWEFAQADAAHAKINLTVGLRQPRWPECHAPSFYDTAGAESQWYPQLKAFMTAVINRYKHNPALSGYQLENEYFLKQSGFYGACDDFSRARLTDEYELVRRLDPNHPIIIGRSNNDLGWPIDGPTPDTFSISIYQRVWDTTLHTHRYLEYPFPTWYYAFLAGWQKLFTGKDMVIGELQAEPWPPGNQTILNTSLAEQNKSFDAQRLRNTVQFGKATGMKTIDLWGAEYWYYRLTVLHDPSVWNAAKQIFGGQAVPTQLFTMTDSGSTNTGSWKLTVYSDGSGQKSTYLERFAGAADQDPAVRTIHYPKGTFAVTTLAKQLAAYGSVRSLGGTACLKSASFGTVQRISYHGATSQDISCGSATATGQLLIDTIYTSIRPSTGDGSVTP